jgi:hypothetical protein
MRIHGCMQPHHSKDNARAIVRLCVHVSCIIRGTVVQMYSVAVCFLGRRCMYVVWEPTYFGRFDDYEINLYYQLYMDIEITSN